jgi:mannose-1-phosphate guanylyltransferase
MDAIVLAGGEGTRLRPLTDQRPKSLVPILGRPLLGLLLNHLAEHGVTRAVLALTRGPSSAAVVRAFTADATLGGIVPRGLDVRAAFEETPLGSGGAIANAAKSLDLMSDPVLVCNGDLVTDIDVTALRAAHREHGAELTIALTEVTDASRFGVAALDGTCRVTTFVEKPAPGSEPSNLANAGFWLFSASLIAAADGREFNRVEDALFPNLVSAGRPIFGFRHTGYWRDVGTPEAYREAVMDALDRTATAQGAPGTPGAPGLAWLDSSARVARTASVRHSSVGADCTLEDGAIVTHSVLWEGVRVGAGAHVENSVLGAGFQVPPGALIRDTCLVPPSAVGAPSR